VNIQRGWQKSSRFESSSRGRQIQIKINSAEKFRSLGQSWLYLQYERSYRTLIPLGDFSQTSNDESNFYKSPTEFKNLGLGNRIVQKRRLNTDDAHDFI